MTLFEVLKTYNFRTKSSIDCDNSQTVRIYLPGSFDNWFEFGCYDYSDMTEDIIMESLQSKLLASFVTSIHLNEEFNILEIFTDYKQDE